MFIKDGKNLSECKVLMKGIIFKENVVDICNLKVVDLVWELMNFLINVYIIDFYVNLNEVVYEYKLGMVDQFLDNYDVVIVVVSYNEYKDLDNQYFKFIMNGSFIFVDLKGIYDFRNDNGLKYW